MNCLAAMCCVDHLGAHSLFPLSAPDATALIPNLSRFLRHQEWYCRFFSSLWLKPAALNPLYNSQFLCKASNTSQLSRPASEKKPSPDRDATEYCSNIHANLSSVSTGANTHARSHRSHVKHSQAEALFQHKCQMLSNQNGNKQTLTFLLLTVSLFSHCVHTVNF